MSNPNLEMLRIAVENLGEIADEMVFVGGCTTGLFITDEGAAEVRATDDVDSIVEVTSYGQYNTFAERLKKIDFREDTREGAPTCRWVKGETVLDVMPLDEKVLGFTNKWYEPAIKAAEEREILPGVTIRVISSPYFCATKFEAFEGRGAGDYLASHDLEDIITVLDGRAEIIDEISGAPKDVREYISGKVAGLLETRQFLDALPGYLLPDDASQGRIKILMDRLKQIAEMNRSSSE
jgi:predicted nucleotidyltransferase